MAEDFLVPNLKLNLKHHQRSGDYSLVIEEYAAFGDEIILTGVFGTTQEVHEEFSKLEAAIAKAKAKALRAVDPAEAGVRSAQAVLAKVIAKADPEATKAP